ncbi:hypothetical protein JCM11641_002543 [Rhodosporidiobolus odoratus]
MSLLVDPPPAVPPLGSTTSFTSFKHSTNDDDLLAETLTDSVNSPDRDYTDDLEDIVSMSVAHQLHSRRSHSNMHTYLPSSPPIPPTASPPLPQPSSRFPSPSPARYPSDSEDASPRFSTLGRSHSTGAGRAGKHRPSAIPRPGGGKLSRTPSPDLGRRKGSLAPSDGEGSGREQDRGWETLQVGGAATSPSAPPAQRKALSPSPARAAHPPKLNGNSPASTPRGLVKPAASTPMGRAKTLDFPITSSSAPSQLGTPSNPASTPTSRHRPSATSTTLRPSPSPSSATTPRKRAQTQAPHLNGSSPASSPSVRGKPIPSRSPNLTTSSSSSNRARRPSAPRTTTNPSPSTTTRPSRRKSLSTAQELSSIRTRANADPISSSPSPSPLPSWSTDPAPLVYRTSKGDLAFASASLQQGEEDLRRLRPEDRVLPAVARRLERERLEQLEREREAGGGGGEGILVNEWGTDGTPRSGVSWRGRETRSGNNTGQAGTRPTAGEEEDQGDGEGEGRPDEPSATQDSMGRTGDNQPLRPVLQPTMASDQPDVGRRGSVPFQAYLSAHPESSQPPRQAGDEIATVSPAGAGFSSVPANTEKQSKEAFPPSRADDEKDGGCCRCIIC